MASSWVTSAAPAASSRVAAVLPAPEISGTSVLVWRVPSAEYTPAASPSPVPRAAIGAAQPPPRAARTARSSVTASRVSASSRALRAAIRVTSSARHSMPSAPCPGAGRMGSSSVIRRASPRRRSPAAASTTASRSPEVTRDSRVSMLPRMSMKTRSGRRARSCATRRGDPVPTRAPPGSSARLRPSREHSASRGDSRSGVAAITSPGTGSTGRSFREWTARSTSPLSSAERSSAANTPSPESRVSDPRS